MAAYHYQQGDRPLDGFTIQYALGRGGFGEVYFAVSDSGREVALKAVQNFEEVELRGIGHCMNLKSPHLVMIFDVKRAADGTPWVIMEYVSGPSLRDILNESPQGLGEEQTKFFLRELAKGLSYLHEAGVVHRDLKPHNVFFEDGIVKIGDYSLSKVITASHRSGNTMTVGSVHYMAPEISLGRYDKTVDIYALGIMLYEMLTGRPPFIGDSLGEVLMKHLSSAPDVSELPEPFAAAVVQAMQKDPADRFQTAQEMVEAVCGTTSLSIDDNDFHPATLSLIGERARAAKVAASTTGRRASDDLLSQKHDGADVSQQGFNGPAVDSTAPTMAAGQDTETQQPRPAPAKTAAILNHLCLHYSPPLRLHAEPDPQPLGLRMLMATVATSILIIVSFRLRSHHFVGPTFVFVVTTTVLLISALATMVSIRTLRHHGGLRWAVVSRLGWSTTLLIAMLVMIMANFSPNDGVPMLFSMAACTLLLDWRCLVAPHRSRRLSVIPVVVIGAVAVLAHSILTSDRGAEWTAFTGAVIMAAAITVQLAAPVRKAASNAPWLPQPPKHLHPEKPRLLYDKTALLLELTVGAAVAVIIGLFVAGSGDGEMIAAGTVAGLVGLFALRFRLQRRDWPHDRWPGADHGGTHRNSNAETGGPGYVEPKFQMATVITDKTSIFLEFLILSAVAILIATIANGDDDLFPVGAGAVAVFLLALRYRLYRRRQKPAPSQRTRLPLSFDRIAIALELIIGACAVAVAAGLYFGQREDTALMFAAGAGAVAVVALRFRLSRRIRIESRTASAAWPRARGSAAFENELQEIR